MKAILRSLLVLLFTANAAMAWFDTRYDTLETKWPNGNQKEFVTRYWFMGNDHGFQPHGQYSTWYESGQLQEDVYYYENTKTGAWIKWFEGGGRSEEAVLVNGKRHGQFIEWHSDRNIKVLGHYKEGKKHGLWTYRRSGSDMNSWYMYTDSTRFYYEDQLAVALEGPQGEGIHTTTSYFNNELGMWIEWDHRCNTDWMECYRWFEIGKKIDGMKSGKWIKMNRRGEILDIFYYKEGEIIGLK